MEDSHACRDRFVLSLQIWQVQRNAQVCGMSHTYWEIYRLNLNYTIYTTSGTATVTGPTRDWHLYYQVFRFCKQPTGNSAQCTQHTHTHLGNEARNKQTWACCPLSIIVALVTVTHLAMHLTVPSYVSKTNSIGRVRTCTFTDKCVVVSEWVQFKVPLDI